MFENKLQWIKRACRRCNFKNPIRSVLEQWSLNSGCDLARLQNASRHEVSVVFASDECVTSPWLVAQEEEGCGPVSLLSALLSGGDPNQFWAFTHIAEVSLHHVHVKPGSFILHWSDDHKAQCLSVVTGILQLRKEEEAGRSLWVDIQRFPGVPAPTAKQLTVQSDVWDTCVADPRARVRVLERFDQLRFTSVRQCPVPGAHIFIVA